MNKLRKTIEATKLSNPELSIKLGHSRKYLTNLLNKGCSTAMQNQLIEEINQVMAGTFKTDAEVIAELTQRLSEVQDDNSDIREELKFQSDQNIGLTTENQELRKTITKYDILVDKKSEDETKLLKENQTLRKNAQEINTKLKRVKDDLDYIKEENDQLRATASKQNELNESLNAECREWRSAIVSKNQKIRSLRQSQKIHRLLSFVCLSTIILLIVTQWGV